MHLFQNPADLKEQQFLLTAMYKALLIVGAGLGAAGSIIGFFLRRYWDSRDRAADRRERELQAKDADQAKLRDILYESLKWFEGGTQTRSIGIAVVNASWNSFDQFRPLWIEVFANQTVYLLAASKSGESAHEHDNLRRIMEILVREKALISAHSKKNLLQTIDDKLSGRIKTGLSLTDDLNQQLPRWRSDLA